MKNLIPKPLLVKERDAKFDLRGISTINIDIKLNKVEKVILDRSTKFLNCNKSELTMDFVYDKSLESEGYSLKICKEGIKVFASTSVGALYGFQTIRQMAKLDSKSPSFLISCGEIFDKPQYKWRGILLDEARHFFGKDTVKLYLELMSMHKLNILHWHLSDDQGWRIEIKKYPLLTEIGSKREKSNIHGWSSCDDDNTPHSGYYTQEDIKEILAFADSLGISVNPEIDMPAHFSAAFASYSYLGCRDIKVDVPWYFGGTPPLSQGITDWNRSACIGKESTFKFIFDVIDEICELFPFPYFHIGGDEAPKEEWEKCPDCQALIKREGLANVKELQGYFINRINAYIKQKGKSLVGWNEVLEGNNLDSDVVIQYWVPSYDKNVAPFIKKGGKVVFSKHQFFYFDMSFAQVPLKKTYSFSPIFDGITAAEQSNILGIEAPLWSEWIADRDKLDFQAFPRMEALAEIAWTKDKADYSNFLLRVENFKSILDGFGINYCHPKIADPNIFVKDYRIKQWYKKDPDVEYNKNKLLKGENT